MLLQEPAFKQLAIALCISALIHAFFIDKFYLLLPTLKQNVHTIEARIEIPKVVEKAVEAPKPEEKPAPAPPPVKTKKVKKSKPIEPPPVPEPTPEPVTESAPVEPSPQVPTTPPPEQVSEPASVEPQPADAGVVMNENAYKYVVTDFDVRTEADGDAKGKAKITYDLQENQQYQLTWLTQAKGLYALVLPDLLQTSQGTLSQIGLQPSHYLYQFGDKVDKTYQADFDWPNKKLTLKTSKETKTVDLPDDAQDLLSFMYQFMHVEPLQRMRISITNGKKITAYDYTFEGEEMVAGKVGELKTIHIRHSNSDQDEKTELWLALDYQYIPIKIRQTKSDGKVYELMATRINTVRPVADTPKTTQINEKTP